MIFRRKSRPDAPADSPAATAVASPPEDLNAEIESLRVQVRERPDVDLERRLLQLRHRAGIALLDDPGSPGGLVEPAAASFDGAGVPEIQPEELSAPLVRAAILSKGCVIVRGLIPADRALEMAEGIEDALAAWQRTQDGEPADAGLYENFPPDPRFAVVEREWVNSAGGIWTGDSPRLMAKVLELFEQSGLRALADDYLGERSLVSLQKGTLRKVPPTAGRGWHQDGAFLGRVKALNTWIALSRCGDESPGMDLVPKRLEEIAPTGTEGAAFNWSVSEQVARETAGETDIVRPIFEPGDVLLFDEMFLHTTAAERSMPNHRYAIETWFFGASAYPAEYIPFTP